MCHMIYNHTRLSSVLSGQCCRAGRYKDSPVFRRHLSRMHTSLTLCYWQDHIWRMLRVMHTHMLRPSTYKHNPLTDDPRCTRRPPHTMLLALVVLGLPQPRAAVRERQRVMLLGHVDPLMLVHRRRDRRRDERHSRRLVAQQQTPPQHMPAPHGLHDICSPSLRGAAHRQLN